MSRHFNLKVICGVGMGIWSGLLVPALGPTPIFGQPSARLLDEPSASAPIPSSWQDDADLRDVFFLDANHGWAVGDLGVIWHSSDGGRTWHRQSTPVDCQLASVHFIDPQNGWAVGGYSHPLTHRSTGIVLRTTDGGRTWEEVSGLLVPWLTSVRFLTKRRGLAAGMVSALHPGGAFSTEDGGRTWTPLQGVSGAHWAHAIFQDSAGLLVSRSGRTAWLRSSRLVEVETGSRPFTSNEAYAALLNARIGFVGHGGGPRLSVDGGKVWQRVGPLPDDTASRFRFATCVVLGSRCWLAGDPGTRVFRSQDHARSWQSRATGSTLPIHKLQFIGVHRGWAVGRRGLILATDDGGQTWKTQRGGGKRAALLGIFADQQDVPWELLTRASAEDQYRVHVVLLSSHAAANGLLRCPPEARLTEATMRIGASGQILTRLPLPEGGLRIPASDLIRRWEQSESHVMQSLTARVTNLIRTWRPEVVLTSQPQPAEEPPSGLRNITRHLVVDACELAASPVAFPEQIRQAGLQPWKTARVVAVSHATGSVAGPASVRGGISRSQRVNDLARRSQQLMQTEIIEDTRPWTLVSLGHVSLGDASPTPDSVPQLDDSPSRLSAKKTDDSESRPTVGRHPFGGLSLEYGASARRPRHKTNRDIAAQRRAIQRQSHVRNVLLRGERLIGDGANLLEQADRLLATTEPAAAGDILFAMAEHAVGNGQLDRAAEIYLRLVTHYGDHALSDHALHWLMAYHASAEIRWWHVRTNNARIRLVSAALPTTQVNPDTPNSSNARTASAPALPQAVSRRWTASQREEPPWQVGFRLAHELKSKRPDLYAEGEILFPLAAILRARGDSLKAKALYRRQLGLPATSPWRGRAAAELALLDSPSSSDALSVWPCLHVNDRPHLDGDLTDVCWQQARTQLLVSSSSPYDSQTGEEAHSETEPVTSVYAVHDDTYLYFAAACEKHPRVKYLPAGRPRPRDADLKGLDRIELLLDINRDYTSAWHITLDHRGWTAESVLGDAQWNPTYYVASAASDLQWTIEVAIPLQELAPPALSHAGTGWDVGVRRFIPGRSLHYWKPHAGVTCRDETNGILLIE